MFGAFWKKGAPDDQTFWSTTEPSIPTAETLLRNMWDGTMVIYYTNTVPRQTIEDLKTLVVANPDLGIVVVPWESKIRGRLPQNRKIAFATWNASQTCHQYVAPAVFDFRDAHPAADGPGHDGTKPQVLTDTVPINVTQ